MGQTLDDFQLDTLDFLDRAHGRAVVADPMGARKTATVLSWINLPTSMGHVSEGEGAHCVTRGHTAHKVLIIAPASVHGHWHREAHTWAPDFPVIRGTGSAAKRAEASLTASCEELCIYITTYESAKIDQHALLEVGFDAVVFDEGHKLKGRRTQVALMANTFAKKIEHCVIVTGTPVMNHAAELWQYLHMLAPKEYPAFWKWVMENFKVEERRFQGNRFPTRIIHDWKEGRLDLVRAQTSGFFIQRDIKELFPNAAWIEEAEHVLIDVVLSPAERKAYDQLVKHNWTLVEGKEVVTGGSLDLTTRLNQLVSSWAALGGDEGSKVRSAVELIENLLERDEKVLVLVKYKETLAQLADKLGMGVAVTYHGSLSQEQRDANLAEFCSTARNSSAVMIGTLDSLSEGVDGMQHVASNIVMLDRHWVPAKNDQAIGRLRRSGQLKRVTVYHVFADGTIDETITAACIRKQNVIEALKGQELSLSLYGMGRG